MPVIDLRLGDCLSVMGDIADGSIDLIACDPPYGTTACKWDVVIPFEPTWAHYKRLLKPRGVVVLTASQPFTSMLVMSNREWFRHEWVWIKNSGSNFANTVREPMKEHESVVVFGPGRWTFNRQMQDRAIGSTRHLYESNTPPCSQNYGSFSDRRAKRTEKRVPASWQRFNNERGLHPTQKPVALMEYLIRTYSNEGDTVLDSCMGSGTTLVACLNTNRDGIGIEKDPEIFATAQRRLAAEQAKTALLTTG